jgi:3-phenylpropionate/trans-cinnamate dioxygenase ferredoxin component
MSGSVAGESQLVRACSAADIPSGSALAVEVDGVPLAIVHTDCPDGTDAYYAIYDECSHASVALSEGEIDGCTLECWLHGSRFDLRTGEPTGLPAVEPVAVYPVDVRDGNVYVSLTPTNGVSS